MLNIKQTGIALIPILLLSACGGGSVTETDKTVTQTPPPVVKTDTAVTGHVYNDIDGNGSQGASEPDFADVEILITESDGKTQTLLTDASGNFKALVVPGNTTIDIAEKTLPKGREQTQGSNPTNANAVRDASTAVQANGYFVKTNVTGHLYADTDGNGTQDLGEPDLPNVSVLIIEHNGKTHTVTTDENGDYLAEAIPGKTITDIDEATLPTGSVQTEGTDPTITSAIANDSVPSDIDGFSVPVSSVMGMPINSNLTGAEVKMYRFDETGEKVEVVAANAPVTTDVDGSFKFENYVGNFFETVGPLIIETVGGTIDLKDAPRLASVIVDSSVFGKEDGLIETSMSSASTVAAGVLEVHVKSLGRMVNTTDAKSALLLIQRELSVDLSVDSRLDRSGITSLDDSITANLDLVNTPENLLAVNDFIEYLVLNITSSSGLLDNTMIDPANGNNTSLAATFDNIGSGLLASILPNGPTSFILLNASLDKDSIENDGKDTAFLNITLMDATAAMVADGAALKVATSSGQLFLSSNSLLTSDGIADVNMTSITTGNAQTTTTFDVPNGAKLSHEHLLLIANELADDLDAPRLSSAGSTGNTEILVSFSEAMRGGLDSAENPAYYRIVGPDPVLTKTSSKISTDEAGKDPVQQIKPEVNVISAELILPDKRTVKLTTLSQANIEYTLTVTNMTDLAGNPMAPKEILVDPSSTTFQGTAQIGEPVDTDNDAVSDYDEQLGWTVSVELVDGQILTTHVTSDPFTEDTDGDGVSDAEELHAGMNPRSADTDGDTLTDGQEWNTIYSDGTNQDTDGDGIQDGTEYYTFRTSPLLADTDGDQLLDFDEILASNRNPLISDLPSPRIVVGSVNMTLDTRFSYTDETGVAMETSETTEATLTRGTNDSSSSSNEKSTSSSLEFSQELSAEYNSGGDGTVFPSASFKASAGSSQSSSQGSVFTAGQESGRSSEEAYHESLSTTVAKDERETVTREIDGASVTAFLTIENAGDIPFTISNLELTAQSQNPNNRRQVIPVASLVPQNESLDGVNIGVIGSTARGPFVFETETDSVFPQQVQELMKNPRGFLVQIANFDITDEEGRNFSFSDQEVLDRTAGISFDMGDGRLENYRVATNSEHDIATGQPLGISMEYALSVLGLQRYATIRDGGNGIVETIVTGDDNSVAGEDIKITPVGSTIEPGAVVAYSGLDAVINSTPDGDDIWVQSDYATEINPYNDSIRDGGNGIVESEASGDDVQVVAVGTRAQAGDVIIAVGLDGELNSTPNPLGDDRIVTTGLTPHRALTRFRDVEVNAETKSFWTLYSSENPLSVDLDNKILRAGQQYDFAYVQDRDADGVWASEEALHGSSDLLPNTDSCIGGAVRSVDADGVVEKCDFLSDKEEIQEGWKVKLAGSPEFRQVYPNPNQGDSDRDLLFDDQEKACKLDPRQRDTDLDGLTDWEEINGKRIVQGTVSDMVSIDPFNGAIVYTISPYTGNVYEIDPDTGLELIDPITGLPVIDKSYKPHDPTPECNTATGVTGFATDPLNKDTDGDLIDDAIELRLGLNPNDPSDGALFLDDDGDGIPNQVEVDGYLITVNGSVDAYRVTSLPQNRDSDGDGLPDLLESFLGSNPSIGTVDRCFSGSTQICSESGEDTDGDGISDFNEYKAGGFACITTTPGSVCVPFNSLFNDGWRSYVIKCEEADLCNSATIDTDVMDYSLQTGTNLNEKDSDFDFLTDINEITGVEIIVNGATESVSSSPILANSDSDLLDDFEERTEGTNPTNPDTDGDMATDDAEVALGSDPTNVDKRIKVVLTGSKVVTGSGEDIEPRIDVFYSLNGGSFIKVADLDGNDIADGKTFGTVPQTLFTGGFLEDSTIKIKFSGREIDTTNDDIFGDAESTLITFDSSTVSGAVQTISMSGDDNKVEFQLTVTDVLTQ